MDINISDKQKSRYLENPNLCPFCGSDQINVIGKKQMEGVVMLKVLCDHCHIHWIEEYKLVNIKNAQTN